MASSKYRPKEKLTVNVVSSADGKRIGLSAQEATTASISASEDLGYIKGRKRKVETERSEK